MSATDEPKAGANPATPGENVSNWRLLHREGYFAKHPRYQERLHTLGLDRIVALLEPKRTDQILDVGCGYGRLAYHIVPKVACLVGIDLAEEPLAEARALLQGRGTARFVLGDGLGLGPIATGSIDAAYCFTVLQHMTRAGVQSYVREFARVLRPDGGRVCLQFFDDGLRRHEQVAGGGEQSLDYSPEEICRIVATGGLKLERLERESLEHLYPDRNLTWWWVLAIL